jgi:DNA invertase Pin-like site-specific DNA recombinase
VDEKRTLWRIGIWCAVSSKAQAGEDKVSLGSQEGRGRAFAESVGGEVVALYVVPGQSRSITFYSDAMVQIEAYRQLREDVEAGLYGDDGVLWGVDIDRLGRRPALQQQVIELVEDIGGGEVYLESSPHVLGRKSRGHKYIELMQGGRTSEEQQERKRRHRMGMKGRVEKRGLLPGRPPFYLRDVRDEMGEVRGYEFTDRVGALDLMTDHFLRGIGYAEITRRLNASRYRPPEDRKRWWHGTVQYTMRSDVPAGIPSWGPYRAPGPSERIPARWDGEVFAAVVRERQRRSRAGWLRPGSGPLTGVVFCERCGGAMTRMLSRAKVRYVRCGRHAQKTVYPEWACHPNFVREQVVLGEVGAFLRYLSTPGALEQALAELGPGGEQEDLRADLGAAERAGEDFARRRVRLAHAFAAGDVDIGVYRQTEGELAGQEEAARAQAVGLAQALGSLPDVEQRRGLLAELAGGFEGLLGEGEPAAVSTMLQEAGIRVFVEDGQVGRIRLG